MTRSKFIVLWAFVLSIMSSVCLSSCSDDDEVSLKSISIQEGSNIQMNVGDFKTLHISFEPSDLEAPVCSWTSRDENIVTVNSNGEVKALKAGHATVVASVGDLFAECTITVNRVLVSEIKLDVEEVTIFIGDTLQLSATVLPEDATFKELVWSSSDNSIATVSDDGLIAAIAVGSCEIFVADTKGDAKSKCTLTVVPVMMEEILIDKSTLALEVSERSRLTATIQPANTTNSSIVWKSSDETVATVDADGYVTAVSVGSCTITVSDIAESVSASCQVEVSPISVKGIQFVNITDDDPVRLLIGEELSLSYKITPANAANKNVTWYSSNEDAVSVSSEGVITAKALGESVVSIITEDGNYKCSVKVNVVELTDLIDFTASAGAGLILNGVIMEGSKFFYTVKNNSKKSIYISHVVITDSWSNRTMTVTFEVDLAANSEGEWTSPVKYGIMCPIHFEIYYESDGVVYVEAVDYDK